MKKFLLLYLAFIMPNANAEILQYEMKAEKKPRFADGSYWVHTFLGKTNSITVPEGKSLTIIDFFFDRFNSAQGGSVNTRINARYGSSTNTISNYAWGSNYSSYSSPVGKSFAGPCSLELILEDTRYFYVESNNSWDPEGGYVLYRFELMDREKDSLSSGLIPSSSVVVPANAAGDVDVLLEQSTDMITWTQCLPGTYNASTQKRFFRVRAVEK